MNYKLVANAVGKLLILIAVCMLIPLGMALALDTNDFIPFKISFVLTLCFGLLLNYGIDVQNNRFSYREAFAISVFSWLSVGAVSCLPMFITDYFSFHVIFKTPLNEPTFANSFTNSLFESLSGYTGTAATILQDIETVPHPLIFWRCFHNWLGGMGIIVLFVAILPNLGAAGSKLFQSESSLSLSDSSSVFPKIRDMAKILWGIYLTLSIVLLIILLLLGMNLFDAICHTFGTMATGGFSSKNASISHFNSIPIELTIGLFMFICGMNFLLVRSLLLRDFKNVFKNTEFKVYFFTISICILLVSSVNYLYRSSHSTYLYELREAFFNVISLGTSTGFGMSDYDLWPAFSKILLFGLMLMGGCAGSTAGGFKVFRMIIIIKWIQREFKRLTRPHGVYPLMIKNQVIDQKNADNAIGFVVLYILTILGFGLLIGLIENDVITAFTGVVACVSNMGPGFQAIGPTDNFYHLSTVSKLILSICMVIGRLELMAFYILFTKKVWKR